jgi:phospholipase/carboxylesterase
MKNLIKLFTIFCIFSLIVSCQCIKKDKNRGEVTRSKECSEKSRSEKCPLKKDQTCCKTASQNKGDEKSAIKCQNLSDPDSINPYCPNVGNFLDTDLMTLRKKADEAYNSGDFEKSAKYYIALLNYNIKDPNSIYNLACCYGLLGKADLAAKNVERAYKAGFEGLDWIKEDKDFDKVKNDEVFKATIAKLEDEAKKKQAEHGELAYVKSESFMNCYIKLPEGFNPDKSYTLIVGLHGLGSNPENFAQVYKRFENPDFIYAVPQAQYPLVSDMGDQGYSWGLFTENKDLTEKAKASTEKYIISVIEKMQSKYKIGDVYLLGFSQGAFFTYFTGIEHYDLFKGIICFGGWIEDWFEKELADNKMIDIEKAKHLKIFIAHGTKDNIVKFEQGTEARDKLKALGFDVTFYQFDGVHAVPEDAVKEVGKWLKAN